MTDPWVGHFREICRDMSISLWLILNGEHFSIGPEGPIEGDFGTDENRRFSAMGLCVAIQPLAELRINKAQKQKTSFACLLRIGVEIVVIH